MITRGIALLFLMFSSALFAVEIEGPITIGEHRLGEFSAKGLPDGAAVLWDVSDEDSLDFREIGGKLLLTGKPGTYSVRLTAIRLLEGKTVVDRARLKLKIEDSGPTPVPPNPPEPGPNPNPGPRPQPLSQLWIVIVEESKDAAKDRGKMFQDRKLAERISAKNHKLRILDKDVRDSRGNVPKDVQPWIERAKSKKLPWLFLINQSGEILHEGELVNNPANLIRLLETIGG